jgi:predicted regulator of Ras-like GTPase activity (Roadblock/LC7/MglB family)
MQQILMDMLEYRVVLGAVVTTLDGLLIAHAGVRPEDAEVLSAASSSQSDDEPYSTSETHGGVLHVLRGRDMRLIVLTDIAAPQGAVTVLMHEHLILLEESIAV